MYPPSNHSDRSDGNGSEFLHVCDQAANFVMEQHPGADRDGGPDCGTQAIQERERPKLRRVVPANDGMIIDRPGTNFASTTLSRPQRGIETRTAARRNRAIAISGTGASSRDGRADAARDVPGWRH